MGDEARARVLQMSADDINPTGEAQTTENEWINSARQGNAHFRSLIASVTPEQRDSVFDALQGTLPTDREIEMHSRQRDNGGRSGQTVQRPSLEASHASTPPPNESLPLSPPILYENQPPFAPAQHNRQNPTPTGRFARWGSTLIGMLTHPFGRTATVPDHFARPAAPPTAAQAKEIHNQ